MKNIRFSILIHFLLFACLTDAPFAQDYTQHNVPEGAKRRIGTGTIVDMTYSPDGTQLAVATPLGIWIYDARTGREVNTLLGHPGYVTGIAYAPDGRTLASGCLGRTDTIILWDAVTGVQKSSFTGQFSVYCIAFSPDGNTIATGTYESVELWDAVSGKREASFITHPKQTIDDLAFSPDGKTLGIGVSSLSTRLWDVATRTHKVTLTGEASAVRGAAFSPDSRTLATVSKAAVELWDAVSGKRKATLPHRTSSKHISFSPDGRTLATGGTYDGVQLWDVLSGQRKAAFIPGVVIDNIAFSPDGKTIATGSYGEVQLSDAVSGRYQKSLASHMGGVWSLTFSPDGHTLASAGQDKTIHLWDGRSGGHKTTLTGHTDSVSSLAFSPDGKTLVSGSWDKTIRVWDVASGVQKSEFVGHTLKVTSVALSPDGKTLVSGSWDKTIRVWDVASGTHTVTHTEYINSVAFSPDGKTIATGGEASVELYDARTRQHRHTLKKFTDGYVYRVAFSPDGKTIAVTTDFGLNSEMSLWTAATGEYIASKKGFSFIDNFAFSPDGRTLLTPDKSGVQVMLWDAFTGVVHNTFLGTKRRGVSSYAFSPDGKTIVAGTEDGFILFWELTPPTVEASEETSVFLPRLPERPPQVRIIYFLASNHTPHPTVNTELGTLIKETQHFYAEQMQSHGFGRKTFAFETDSHGEAVVHHVNGRRSAEAYIKAGNREIIRELEDILDLIDHIYLVVLDTSLQGSLGAWCGLASVRGWVTSPGNVQMQTDHRLAIVYASGTCAGLSTTAHELGHTFGLAHDARKTTYLMHHTSPDTPRLSYAAAEWLNVHPLFNPGQPDSQNHTTIQVLSPRDRRLQFQVADADGLQQAQLILNNIKTKVCGGSDALHHFKALNGSRSITFELPTTPVNTKAQLKTIDVHGNITWRNIWLKPDDGQQGDSDTSSTNAQTDVNGDGVVNIQDLVFVASNLGKTGKNAADVNNDGVVNIQDLVRVAGAFGNAAAAQ